MLENAIMKKGSHVKGYYTWEPFYIITFFIGEKFKLLRKSIECVEILLKSDNMELVQA